MSHDAVCGVSCDASCEKEKVALYFVSISFNNAHIFLVLMTLISRNIPMFTNVRPTAITRQMLLSGPDIILMAMPTFYAFSKPPTDLKVAPMFRERHIWPCSQFSLVYNLRWNKWLSQFFHILQFINCL